MIAAASTNAPPPSTNRLARAPATAYPAAMADQPTRLPARAVLVTATLFWLIYFAVNSFKAWLGTDLDSQLDMLPRRAAVSIVGVGLTLAFHRALVPLDQRPISTRIAAVAIGAAVFAELYAAVNTIAFYAVAPPAKTVAEIAEMRAYGEGGASMWFKVALDTAVSWYFFFAAWGALYLALGYAAASRDAERRAAAYRAAAHDAQLRALRYQINPHFLFNTLNSLSAFVMRGKPEEAERMILKLSTFFRTSLTMDPLEDVTLAEELRLQRLYLDIEAVRFPERLIVRIDVPPEFEAACVPTLILQPLVENAIKHGVARSLAPVTITIRALASPAGMLILVEDDGAPQSGPCTCPGTGTGLANVRARLAARFGDAADCAWGPRDAGGFRAALRLPLLKHAC